MKWVSALRLPAVSGLGPGLLASLIIAAAAAFLADHYGGPVMLFALLLGMAMNFLSEVDRCKAGVAFASRTVLRLGVALLGFRITIEQIAALGWQPIALVVAAVSLTIFVSIWAAKAMGFRSEFGLLSGGATAICGASAAMALSAALPAHERKERATSFTIIGVSTLSTLAMILYPAISNLFGFDDHHAGDGHCLGQRCRRSLHRPGGGSGGKLEPVGEQFIGGERRRRGTRHADEPA